MTAHIPRLIVSPGKPSLKTSFLFSPVLLLLALGTGGCQDHGNQQKTGKRPPMQAEAYIVKTDTLRTHYQTSGNLLPNEEIKVYAETPGRITQIHFREGSHVRKGALLVQLFDQDIRAQIRKLKVQKELQLTTQVRQQELLDINGISRQEYDQTLTQIASIDADIAYNEAQLRKLQIRAPFSGVIGLRNVSVGAIVNSATLISTIQQLDPLKMDFAIPEQYNDRLRVGSTVHFTVTGNRDTFSGKISAIQPAADASTRTITMRAIIPNPSEQLIPGAFANVYIPFEADKDAITIPSQCIIPTPRDKRVAVVNKGKVNMVPVTTGRRLVNKIEITTGLNPGDTVLTTGIMQVKQGMDIRVSRIIE